MPAIPALLASRCRRLRARGFPRDRRGNFGIIAALAAIPLIVMVGAGVDYNMALRGQSRVQAALDSANLAAARAFQPGAAPAAMLAVAQPFFDAGVAGLKVGTVKLHYDGVTQNGLERSLSMHATYRYDPVFLPLGAAFGLPAGGLDMTINSRVVLGGQALQIAMVLDNSGSMRWFPQSSSDAPVGQRRIDVLKEAASDLVTSVMGDAATADAVKVGVVPFSGSVNVGKRFAGEAWVDTDGRSPIHHENFDWRTFSSARPVREVIGSNTVTRWKLNDTWLTRQWLLENAVSNAVNEPQRNTCQPMLPTGLCTWTWNSGAAVWTMKLAGVDYCTSATNAKCWPSTVRTQNGSKVFPAWEGCFEARGGALADTDAAPDQAKPETLFVPFFAPDEYDWSNYDYADDFANDYLSDTDGLKGLPAQRDMLKYVGKADSINESVAKGYETKGPNKGCIDTELLPLTGTRQTVLDTIDAMVPAGSTNIPEGMAWGWRVLSPGVPFTESAEAVAKGQATRMLLVMTDGENTYYDGSAVTASSYGAYGYSKVYDAAGTAGKGRIYAGTGRNGYNEATYTKAMNDHVEALCDRVKADGILVATITLSTGKPSGRTGDNANVSDRLLACASPSPKNASERMFYYASNASELKAAFSDVLAQVSSLRIAH